jgi:hypothetical protein
MENRVRIICGLLQAELLKFSLDGFPDMVVQPFGPRSRRRWPRVWQWRPRSWIVPRAKSLIVNQIAGPLQGTAARCGISHSRPPFCSDETDRNEHGQESSEFGS